MTSAEAQVASSNVAVEGGCKTLWAGPETISRAMKQGYHPVQGTVRKELSPKLFSGEDFGRIDSLARSPRLEFCSRPSRIESLVGSEKISAWLTNRVPQGSFM